MNHPSLPPDVVAEIARIRADGEARAARARAEVEARRAAELAAFQAREHRRGRLSAALGIMVVVLTVGGAGVYSEISARDARIEALKHEVQTARERAAEVRLEAEANQRAATKAREALAELEASAITSEAPAAQAPPASDDTRAPAVRPQVRPWRRPAVTPQPAAVPDAAPCAPGDPLCASDLGL